MNKIKKIMRYAYLILSIVISSFVIFANLGCFDIGSIFFLFWMILPNVVFFFVTIKFNSYPVILIPAITTLLFDILVVKDYFGSSSSTAAIVFIFSSLYKIGIIILGMILGAIINFIIKKIIRKNNNQE